MKKDFAFGALIVMAVLFIIGLVLIFASLSIGTSAGTAAMNNNGGYMDTAAYERIINTTILNYRTAGIILSTIGGIGVLLSGYTVYRELK